MKKLKITKKITVRDSDAIEKYLNEIHKTNVLSPEEEDRILRRIKEGDQKAQERLISCNLRFVISVAKQYQNQGLSLDDLISEGNFGLVKAAEFFDPTKGFKFISYAVWWIRQSILQAIGDYGRLVRLPVNKVNFIRQINQTSNHLEQRLLRNPSEEEIAEAMHTTPKVIREHRQAERQPLYLDSPLPSYVAEEDTTSYELFTTHMLPPEQEEVFFRSSLSVDIQRFLRTLNEREIIILVLHYGLNGEHPLSMEEIAGKLNVSPERVRQLKGRAMRKLTRSKNIDLLKGYL
ncbi:MAG: sigma-70 family RNA polymerase sigma factor [Culturomica sp.]|jgi:RNA polymerase primary sigma factor|nr:sigma-70 family RNA polymerase sigma factor [Culturomica sp.]